MKEIRDIFEAKALSFYGTMKCHDHSAGYRIPNYQRDYDWSPDHISRLIIDCLNGLYGLSEHGHSGSFTFLGTLILVRESKKEPSFDGDSLSVVDGQQRLTTLVLMACALIEQILTKSNEISITDIKVTRQTKVWIDKETEFQLDRLYECIVGQQSGRSEKHPYPRIVREKDGDARGGTNKESEYKSAIAVFLRDFSKYYKDNSEEENPIFMLPEIDNNAASTRLCENYKFIKEKIEELSASSTDESFNADKEFQYLSADKFKAAGTKDLFEKMNIFEDDSEKNKALSFVSTNKEVEPLVRLLLFASYMTRYVVLTSVETDDESAAFDIFDSLNTTGEPLTAIQTLRPLTIRFEQKNKDLKAGYVSGEAFDRISEHVINRFPNPVHAQTETKELIVSFALYIEGRKLPKSLSVQRNYLRGTYKKIPDKSKHNFIVAIADLAAYRHYCWDKDGIRNNLADFSSKDKDEIQICLSLIADMNTSLAIPILCRYWTQYNQSEGGGNFLNALKALTAFIVIRRAVTGRTGGIDTVFRSLMGPRLKSDTLGGDPLSVGLNKTNEIWSVDDFKKQLRERLADRNIDVTDKQNWIKKVIEIPIASQSRPLARFILLAAAHHADVDPKKAGCWSRSNVRPSDGNKYLCYDKWVSANFATLEHVAPENPSGNGWDGAIYENQHTKHTLGNLLLLPRKENTSIGNQKWPKKKIFYQALTAKTKDEVNDRMAEAEKAGFEFQKATKELLKNGERLQFLDPVRDVKVWDAKFIKERTKNIADLAWDTIEPWLWDK